MDQIRYLIEALRNRPQPGVYRGEGMVPKRIRGGLMEDLQSLNKGTNYAKYLRQQAAIGESGVSREEFMRDM